MNGQDWTGLIVISNSLFDYWKSHIKHLDEDSEFMDNIVSKVSQLKTLKEEVERKRRELETSQTQNLERRLTQMQEQMSPTKHVPLGS